MGIQKNRVQVFNTQQKWIFLYISSCLPCSLARDLFLDCSKKFFTTFNENCFPLLLDVHSGTSNDWYTSLGSRFVYTTELRDQGYSFLLPPEQIIPSGEEMWAAYEVMLAKAIEVSREE